VEKNSKTISHFCGLFGWLLGQLRFYKFFKNKKFLETWEVWGKNFTREKEKENHDNAWSAHYFIFNRLISQLWRFLPKF